MLWHARLTAIVFIFNGLLSTVTSSPTIANKDVVSSKIYSESGSLSSENPRSTERSPVEKPDDSKYLDRSDAGNIQLYSAESAGRFRRPGKTPKNGTKSGLFESFGNILLNFVRNAEDKFAKIFLHPGDYLDRGDLIVSRSKGLSSNSSEPFEIRYEAVRVLKPRVKRRGSKRTKKQKDQKLGALEKRDGEDSSLISSRLSMNKGNMKKNKSGSGLSKKKQNKISRKRKFKNKTKKGRKTSRNRKYRQVKSKLLRERRNTTFDTSQLHKSNVKNFKEQEKRFEGLFSSLTSEYGKQKMSHIMQNDEFDFDALADSKFWKEYPKYFNLNHTDDVRSLISEQNKTFLMFEGLDNKDKKEVMKEYSKYGALMEISKMKRSLNRRKRRTRSLNKRSQSMFQDFKDMFQDILGGMAPRPLRKKRFSRKKGTRRTFSPSEQSENIKGGDEFLDAFQNRPKDKLIMSMLLKTSRDAVKAAEKERLLHLASQVETKRRGPHYLTENDHNPGSRPAPESPSLKQKEKSKRKAKLGKRYTIDNDESQDQEPNKPQYNKRNFMDSLRALYEDVIG